MFERAYVDDPDFSLEGLNKLLGYLERSVEHTMPLVCRYTLSDRNRGRQ
jgi:hypothetical protein